MTKQKVLPPRANVDMFALKEKNLTDDALLVDKTCELINKRINKKHEKLMTAGKQETKKERPNWDSQWGQTKAETNGKKLKKKTDETFRYSNASDFFN